MSIRYDSESASPSTPTNKAGVRIDGDCLVVPRDYVFPKFSIVTGQLMDFEPKETWFHAMEVVGGLYLPRMRGAKARVYLCIEPSLRRRDALIKISLFIVFGVAVGTCAYAFSNFHEPAIVFLAWVLICGYLSFVAYKRLGLGIYSPKIEKSYLWIRGIRADVMTAIYESGKA